MTSRKATKNLPIDEWMTSYHGRVGGGKPDLQFSGPRKSDMRLVYNSFCLERNLVSGRSSPSFVDELEARGYDLSTLEFRIKLKAPKVQEPTVTSVIVPPPICGNLDFRILGNFRCNLPRGHEESCLFEEHNCSNCGTGHGVCRGCGTTHGDSHSNGCKWR